MDQLVHILYAWRAVMDMEKGADLHGYIFVIPNLSEGFGEILQVYFTFAIEDLFDALGLSAGPSYPSGRQRSSRRRCGPLTPGERRPDDNQTDI